MSSEPIALGPAEEPEFVYLASYRPPGYDQPMDGPRQQQLVQQAEVLAEKLCGEEHKGKFRVSLTLYIVDVRGKEVDVTALPGEMDGFVRDIKITKERVRKKKKKGP